tara:strand:+ start:97 stop:711 length:615 start_codon:yes stop_codon:yes gene_type:complete
MNIQELKLKSSEQLITQAEELGIENASTLRKQEILFAILKKVAEKEEITGAGVLQLLQDGFGFLRAMESNYLPGPDDIYVSPSQIRKFGLRTGNKAERLKRLSSNLKVIDWGEIPNFDMIINATSLGLNKEDKIIINFSKIEKDKLFFDIIYNPSETNFLTEAKNNGNIVENGKKMFIYQALASFKIWHGVQPEINDDTIKLLD